jgi:hypothetical protein
MNLKKSFLLNQIIIMNEITDSILVNLKIISKINPNDKLKVASNSTSIEKEGLMSWLSRWYYGDSREKTINFIKTVVTDAINITNDIMNSTYINNKMKKTVYEENEFTKSLNTLFLVRNEMENCKTGILNLKKTYEMDIHIISQLEVIINKIDIHLSIIGKKLKDVEIEVMGEHHPPTPTAATVEKEKDKSTRK